MTTNELEGRALHEAAARAMGWDVRTTPNRGAKYYGMGIGRDSIAEPPTQDEMLAWLHARHGEDGVLVTVYMFASETWAKAEAGPDWRRAIGKGKGRDLREALERLVVAVKEREAKQA